MKWLGRIASGLLVILGLIAIAQDMPSLIRGSSDFMDFTGIAALLGMLLILLGVVPLLDDRYGNVAPGVRRTAVWATSVTGLIVLRMLTLDGLSVEGSLVMSALVILIARQIARKRTSESSRSSPEDPSPAG